MDSIRGKSVFDILVKEEAEQFQQFQLQPNSPNSSKKRKLCETKAAPFSSDVAVQTNPFPNETKPPIRAPQEDKWTPAAFMKKACLDSATGKLLSLVDCEKNIENLLKCTKPVDYYPLVELACTDGVKDTQMEEVTLSVAFSLMMGNRKNTKVKEDNHKMDEILVSLPNVAFDLAAARQMDRIVYFPGGFPVLITDHITAKMNSEFVLTEKEDVISTIANTIRRILHQLHSKDNYFPMYTTPTAHQKKVHYVPIQEEVFDHFANILITGYSLENNDKIKTKVFAVLQNTVYYFLERLRAEFNKKHGEKSCVATARDFAKTILSNPLFRMPTTAVKSEL